MKSKITLKSNWTKFKYKNHHWTHKLCIIKELFSKTNAISRATVLLIKLLEYAISRALSNIDVGNGLTWDHTK